MMKTVRAIFVLTIFFGATSVTVAQQGKDDLGDKEYIIVKDYIPVLTESVKISDNPEGDTASATPPVLDNSIRSKKMETSYETSVIKAVRIKDESLPKLYRNLIKLGIGNYTKYNGEAYINSLRSKKGSLGLDIRHLSGSPGLRNAGDASYSTNHAAVYGKYFLEKATFSGDFSYDRDVVHYYGYKTSDTIIDKKDIKQRFNDFAFKLGIESRQLQKDALTYRGGVQFATISDLYDVTENDFTIEGGAGKRLSTFDLGLDASFSYFSKSLASGEMLQLNSNLDRSLVRVNPSISFNQDKVRIKLGASLEVDKQVGSRTRLFPKADVSVPIAENILYLFGGVDGGMIKNTYRSITKENPFVSSFVTPVNSIKNVELFAGMRGNFSSRISFTAKVSHSTYEGMQLFFSDTVFFNKFNVLYADGSVLNIHAEAGYKVSDKLDVSLSYDQYSYSMDHGEKAWHLPENEAAIKADYSMRDKLLLKAALFVRGKYDVRIQQGNGFTSDKVDGYMDANLGIEYRYSKILSFYINMNNLGFSRYQKCYRYPMERFNILGGLTYSF